MSKVPAGSIETAELKSDQFCTSARRRLACQGPSASYLLCRMCYNEALMASGSHLRVILTSHGPEGRSIWPKLHRVPPRRCVSFGLIGAYSDPHPLALQSRTVVSINEKNRDIKIQQSTNLGIFVSLWISADAWSSALSRSYPSVRVRWASFSTRSATFHHQTFLVTRLLATRTGGQVIGSSTPTISLLRDRDKTRGVSCVQRTIHSPSHELVETNHT